MPSWPSEAPARRFTAPIPPSANNLFPSYGLRSRRKSPDYRRWLHDAGWAVKLQKVGPIAGLVRVLIEAPLHRRRDVDNALKPLLDLLVAQSVIADDNLIDDLRIVRAGFGEACVVSIWAMEG
jgi:crossover junction endodeoxyribonuclease RusA